MTLGPIHLRDKVLRNIAVQGGAGAAWLAALPSLLHRLEAEWSIEVGRLFPNATEAFVSEAVTSDGQQVALKIPVSGLPKAERQLRLLRIANGRGYVQLLRHDLKSGAMLLERLGLQLAQLGLPIKEQIEIICQTLEHAWTPLPPGTRFPTGAEKAMEMSAYISTMAKARAALLGEGHRGRVAVRRTKARCLRPGRFRTCPWRPTRLEHAARPHAE